MPNTFVFQVDTHRKILDYEVESTHLPGSASRQTRCQTGNLVLRREGDGYYISARMSDRTEAINITLIDDEFNKWGFGPISWSPRMQRLVLSR